MASVTAGFKCPPLIPAETYTPIVTAKAYPQFMANESPNFCPLSTLCATLPSPKA